MYLGKVFKFLKSGQSNGNPVRIDDTHEEYILIGNEYLFFRIDRKDWKEQVKGCTGVELYRELYEYKSTKELVFDKTDGKDMYIFKRTQTGEEVHANRKFFEFFKMDKVKFQQAKDNLTGLIEVAEDGTVVAMICPIRIPKGK